MIRDIFVEKLEKKGGRVERERGRVREDVLAIKVAQLYNTTSIARAMFSFMPPAESAQT
jgi:hypothetical protein